MGLHEYVKYPYAPSASALYFYCQSCHFLTKRDFALSQIADQSNLRLPLRREARGEHSVKKKGIKLTRRLIELIKDRLPPTGNMRHKIWPKLLLTGTGLLIVITIASRTEHAEIAPFPKKEIYSNTDGVIKKISSIGEYVGPQWSPSRSAYTVESIKIQQALDSTERELASLIKLLPSSYAAAVPPSWLGWGESDLDYIKPELSDHILKINSDLKHKKLNLRHFIESPKEKLTEFEISLFESNPKYAFMDRQLLRQALVDVTWELFLRSVLLRQENSCGITEFCPTSRDNEVLRFPLIEEAILDAEGISAITTNSEYSELPDIDLCGDRISSLNTIANEIGGKASRHTVPRSNIFNLFASNPQHLDDLTSECKELNSKFRNHLSLALSIRKTVQSVNHYPISNEARKELIEEIKKNYPDFSLKSAEQFADVIINNARAVFQEAKPGQPKVAARILSSADRPKFRFAGNYFSVLELEFPITYLGQGRVAANKKWLIQEVDSQNHQANKWEMENEISRTFSNKLNQLAKQGITELEIAARQAYDVTDATELVEWSRTQRINREARRAEIYSDIVFVINKLAAERQLLLSSYAGGRQHLREDLKIEASWVMPGETVKQGDKLLSGTPVFRWIIKGSTPRFDHKKVVGDSYLVRVKNIPNVPLPPELLNITNSISSGARDALFDTIKSAISERNYRLTIRQVEDGLLRNNYIGWIEDIDPPYLNISKIRNINAEHANEIITGFAKSRYFSEFGNSILLYMAAGTLDPEYSYEIERQ